jgi:thioredoxin reductase
MEDVVICGGGPAGLAAALWLGRYRRKTLLLDASEARNAAAHDVSGYLTRDGCLPREITDAARKEVGEYRDVTVLDGHVSAIEGSNGSFELASTEGDLTAHRVILATGVQDLLPDIPGFMEHYGSSIFHCSCCDGYEARDERVLAIGWGEHAAGFALDLLDWGAHVTLVTNGQRYEGDRSCEIALQRHGVEVIEEGVSELLSDGGGLRGARLSSGRELEASKAFFSIGHRPRNGLARQIGCRIDGGGYVEVGAHGETSVQGIYAIGDLTPGEQLVQTAAAEGAVAGIACAMSLRGVRSLSPAPAPGPDPQQELST